MIKIMVGDWFGTLRNICTLLPIQSASSFLSVIFLTYRLILAKLII